MSWKRASQPAREICPHILRNRSPNPTLGTSCGPKGHFQTKKSKLFPIILVGKKHYGPLFDWIKVTLAENKLISPEDIDLINLVEDKEEVKQILSDFYEKNNIDINFE